MSTMKAVIINKAYEAVIEERPVPTLKEPTDVIVKIQLTGLCGSDLHFYRGHQPSPPYKFIIGHEFIGQITEVGSAVKNFKVGDSVVAPFTSQCGECFYCTRGQTSRCTKSKVFGSPLLEGVQAEYAFVPLADTTLYHAPSGIPPALLLCMADIFPTGYYVANNAFNILGEPKRKDSVAVVIGCGPVGLCAITAACELFGTVYATDLVESRLVEAKKHGAVPLKSDVLKETLLKATDGRGPDAVMEVVGVSSALNLAVELIRPWGVISSCGLFTHEVKIPGAMLYGKNIRFQFGRCPAHALFPKALELLKEKQDLFKDFVQNTVPLSEAPEYYKLFEQNKIMKTVFDPTK